MSYNKFYEETIEYQVFEAINNGIKSARKIALYLGLRENSTRTIQRVIKKYEKYLIYSDTRRIIGITDAGKKYFSLLDKNDIEYEEEYYDRDFEGLNNT